MYEINKSEKSILTTLFNEGRPLDVRELSKLSGVNSLNTNRAIEKLVNIDYIYIYTENNKTYISITIDGESNI